MTIKLKPINEQVMVITGASSGIGLATAIEASKQGAKTVLVARSESTLSVITEKINESGCEAIYKVCDVANRSEVESVAESVVQHFGRIDTWVNNAGVSIYGNIDEIDDEDSRRLFDVNFWGAYYGSLTALKYLKQNGGAIINVGSETSEAAIPLQGIYSASKHALKGFTDALRIEVEEVRKEPISITLIQPTAVNTPYPQHARNYMHKEPKLPSPMIQPEEVVDAILSAACSPTRHQKVGIMSKVNTSISNFAPYFADKLSAKYVNKQHYNESPRDPKGILHAPNPSNSGKIYGAGGVQ
jgi:short-subunit dehydrogenase